MYQVITGITDANYTDEANVLEIDSRSDVAVGARLTAGTAGSTALFQVSITPLDQRTVDDWFDSPMGTFADKTIEVGIKGSCFSAIRLAPQETGTTWQLYLRTAQNTTKQRE